jgi:hypothetical protein
MTSAKGASIVYAFADNLRPCAPDASRSRLHGLPIPAAPFASPTAAFCSASAGPTRRSARRAMSVNWFRFLACRSGRTGSHDRKDRLAYPLLTRVKISLLESAKRADFIGAGEGNRTLVISLEGFCSTIELRPHPGDHNPQRMIRSQTPVSGWLASRSPHRGRRLVGEVGLEPTKAKPADLQSAPFAARDIPPLAVEPHGISGKLQAIRQPAERPQGGVMVTGRQSVNHRGFPAVPARKRSK